MPSKLYYILLICILGCSNPTPPEDIIKTNPNDPENPTFQEPKTENISVPEVNGFVLDSIFTISWSANEVSNSFSYNLNNTGWSEWQPSKFVVLSYLDDGQYNFFVRSRHSNGKEEKTPLTKIFSINSIKANSIYFYPRKIKVNNYSDFYSEIKIDELKDFTALKIVVLYNPNEIEYKDFLRDSLSTNNILYKNGSPLIMIESDKPGTLILNIVKVGPNPVMSGSGVIGKVKFKSKILNNNQRIYISNSSIVQKGFEKVEVGYYSQLVEK